eukprot:TRINITY_DN17477_c0_g1_i2.p1 TRINITY_DN17477_c0_g1~~TRINITY_DN17477_c0_g1_i2.p1  ORF type:complete len:259 (-),score=24.78 TRINITY_DN17477_c0_g1_i2:889-1665(-)
MSDGAERAPAGAMAGLRPLAFITLATPHLGVSGKNQLPFLLGIRTLEELVAPPLAPFVVGRTGRQLFLTDYARVASKGPLLLRMATEERFLYALAAFSERVLYANAGHDHMVGWRTSSIRREAEVPKLPSRSLSSRYKHVLRVEDAPPQQRISLNAGDNSTTRRREGEKRLHGRDRLEEEMIRGLQQLSWKRADVSLGDSLLPLQAHNGIIMKSRLFHSEAAGVVAHLADFIAEVDSRYLSTREGTAPTSRPQIKAAL